MTEYFAKWRIHPGKGTWIDCIIWEALNDLREHAASKDLEDAWDAHGCYLGSDWVFKSNGDLKSRKLGEIHFFLDAIGAGVVAHEIQHFISHWSSVMGWDVGEKHFEPVALMMGRLTAEFWGAFYDRFTVVDE
jgi:hypothetical protein